MKHYAVTMATTTGQNIRVVYNTFSAKSAGAAAKRKTDFLELINVEECDAPVSRAKANRRYWVITDVWKSFQPEQHRTPSATR